ncbi:PREDICTED: transmembrane protein 14A isoform X2 [Hipposideros armiger]|uniref:Transmembrane protein 14A isoform X2 n=1 Tax=Hipposideros armiger TaxID=186990 RepID=A0A8B7SPL0_HIPAR|nr:PREDICTED: transmembrane protein 14A isoform X2 [Hipposideros armiger]
MRAARQARSGTSGPCRLRGKWGAESQVAGDADRLQSSACSQHTVSSIRENREQDFSGTSHPWRIAISPMDLVGFGYAAFVTFGSIWGYKRRGGILSLIAGLFLGFLAGYGAYRVSNDRRDVKLSLFTAFFLATMMGVRFKRSKKVMPTGLVAGLSYLRTLKQPNGEADMTRNGNIL